MPDTSVTEQHPAAPPQAPAQKGANSPRPSRGEAPRTAGFPQQPDTPSTLGAPQTYGVLARPPPFDRPQWLRLLRGAALSVSALLIAALVVTGLLARSASSDIRNHSAPQITSATRLYFAINDMDAQLANQLMFGTNPELADDRRTAARIYG